MMEKLRAAYQRMNQRERMMTLGVAGILFLLINIFIWKWILGTIGNSPSSSGGGGFGGGGSSGGGGAGGSF